LTENCDGTDPAGTVLYVGIDVGRRNHVAVAIDRERMEDGTWERATARRVPTTAAGFGNFVEWLEGFGRHPDEIRIGCEPTGGLCAETLVAWLTRRGCQVSWLQSWALHERRRLAIGKQTKTDALDARLIARLLYERESYGQVKGFLGRPPRSTNGLRLLVRNRARLIGQRTRYRLQLTQVEDVIFPELKDFFTKSITGFTARRLMEEFPTPADVARARLVDLRDLLIRQCHSAPHRNRIPELRELARSSAGLTDVGPIVQTQSWLLETLRKIDLQIDELEATITAILDGWPASQRAVYESFPCMSKMREALLIATIGDLSTFRHDGQLRKLLGWYPEVRESGTSVAKHRLGAGGNRLARRELWLWAMQLLGPRCPETPFRLYYRRLRARNVRANVAVGHLAGKLISVLFFCLRNEQPYDSERHARSLGICDV
jgi:transposase